MPAMKGGCGVPFLAAFEVDPITRAGLYSGPRHCGPQSEPRLLTNLRQMAYAQAKVDRAASIHESFRPPEFDYLVWPLDHECHRPNSCARTCGRPAGSACHSRERSSKRIAAFFRQRYARTCYEIAMHSAGRPDSHSLAKGYGPRSEGDCIDSLFGSLARTAHVAELLATRARATYDLLPNRTH